MLFKEKSRNFGDGCDCITSQTVDDLLKRAKGEDINEMNPLTSRDSR